MASTTKFSFSHQQQCASSGIRALDDLIGGGYPLGSLVLVESYPTDFYADILMKYFLSQGLCNRDHLYITMEEDYYKKLFAEIKSKVAPSSEIRRATRSSSSLKNQVILEEQGDEEKENIKPQHDMKIAWRYKETGTSAPKLSTVSRTSFRKVNASASSLGKPMKKLSIAEDLPPVDYCCHFDLHQTVDESVFKTAKESNLLTFCTLKDINFLCLNLKSVIEKFEQGPVYSSKILRIGINFFGSAEWLYSKDPSKWKFELFQKLYRLKELITDKRAILFVTLPADLLRHFDAYEMLVNLSDISLSLKAFAENDSSSYSKDNTGILKLEKLSSFFKINPVVPSVKGLPCFTQLQFGFKVKRKKFAIDLLSLPPIDDDKSNKKEHKESAGSKCNTAPSW